MSLINPCAPLTPSTCTRYCSPRAAGKTTTLLRPSDVTILWADASKFMEATGWKPTISYEQTLRDLLDYWRERV